MTILNQKFSAGTRVVTSLVATAALLGALAMAQAPAARVPPRKLRAIGLITWTLGSSGKPVARLFPITVFDDGKFYDAALYHTTSRPLALQADTVYEGQRSGAPAGFFTVMSAQSVEGVWFGMGRWKLNSPDDGSHPGKVRPVFVPDDKDDDRPHLKRSPEGVAEKKAPTAPAEAPARNNGPAPGKEAKASEKREPASGDDDPDRPTLRRGRSATERPPVVEIEGAGKHSVIPAATPPQLAGPNPGPGDMLVAVSDEQTPEARIFSYASNSPASSETDPRIKRLMSTMAASEMRKYLLAHNVEPAAAPTPSSGGRRFTGGSRRAATRETAASDPNLRSITIRHFDLTGSNEDVIVYTAQRTTGTHQAPNVFITLIARLDVEGIPRKIFAQVTDTDHVDIFPRLELVDAVDADGSRRGSLLFRALGPPGPHYAVYKVDRDEVTKVFEGAYTAQ